MIRDIIGATIAIALLLLLTFPFDCHNCNTHGNDYEYCTSIVDKYVCNLHCPMCSSSSPCEMLHIPYDLVRMLR